MTVDIVFAAWNRREFTEFSLEILLRNTDWSLVSNLIIYDDGSEDGAYEYLRDVALPDSFDQAGTLCFFFQTAKRSPTAIMNDYVAKYGERVDLFAKIDNDIAVPPGWLETSLGVMEASPELDLLGLAAGWTGVKDGEPGWEPTSHIGGVGLMRVEAFRSRAPIEADGRYGFTQFQEGDDSLVRGWITPDVLAVQLDLVPAEPWASLSAEYIERGWQRRWPPYEDPTLWQWIEEKR